MIIHKLSVESCAIEIISLNMKSSNLINHKVNISSSLGKRCYSTFNFNP